MLAENAGFMSYYYIASPTPVVFKDYPPILSVAAVSLKRIYTEVEIQSDSSDPADVPRTWNLDGTQRLSMSLSVLYDCL